MAVQGEFYIDKGYQYKKRFNPERFINFENGYFDILQSPLLNQIKHLPTIGTYKVVSHPYRPDVLSHNIYNDTQYWMYLLIYNGIDTIMDLKAGIEIKYFDLDDLEGLLYEYTNKNKRLVK